MYIHERYPWLLLEQNETIFQFLKSLNVAQYLPEIFVLVPNHFVEHFTRFIYIEQLKKDQEWSHAFHDIDKAMLVAIIFNLERLAQAFCRVIYSF